MLSKHGSCCRAKAALLPCNCHSALVLPQRFRRSQACAATPITAHGSHGSAHSHGGAHAARNIQHTEQQQLPSSADSLQNDSFESHAHTEPSHKHGHSHDHRHANGAHGGHTHHGHSHIHHGHSHTHHSTGQSGAHRLLRGVLRVTGVLQLAESLEERVWVSITISLLMIAAYASTGLAMLGTVPAGLAAQLAEAAAGGVYILAGIPALVDLMFKVVSLHVDTHVLMTLACFGTLAAGGALEGALLLTLFQVSHVVEERLTDQAMGSLKALFDSIPQQAVLVSTGFSGEPDLTQPHTVPAAEVQVGQLMLVRAGEQVALDGQVVYGQAMVSSKHITGEALPQQAAPGSRVPAGATNHDGVLVIRASLPSAESTPARIAKLTAEAQARRPRLKRWLDSFGEVYSKAVIIATAVALVVLPLCGVPWLSSGIQRGAVYRAMGLLTTASPCALVLVPLAYTAALAAVTSRGMVVRSAAVMDALAHCGVVALDKTGTLTTGKLSCSAMRSLDGHELPLAGAASDDMLLAASAEDRSALAAAIALSLRSSHPVSAAMAAWGCTAGASLPQPDIRDFKLVPGAGVEGVADHDGRPHRLRFGSAAFAAQGLPPVAADALQRAAQAAGSGSIVSALVGAPLDWSHAAPGGGNGRSHSSATAPALVRLFVLDDSVQEGSAAAVAALQRGTWRHGRAGRQSSQDAMRLVMLTGDGAASAERVAQQLGIADVRAGLLPEQKLQEVHRARSAAQDLARNGVLMAGDGINDAPALAAADVGLAIADATGASAAAAADIVVVNGSGMAAIPYLLAMAHRCQAVIKQNLVLAVGSILVLALPVLLGAIPLWLAVAAHEGSTLLVALNSLRLLREAKDAGTARLRASVVPVDTIAANKRQGSQGVSMPLPA